MYVEMKNIVFSLPDQNISLSHSLSLTLSLSHSLSLALTLRPSFSLLSSLLPVIIVLVLISSVNFMVKYYIQIGKIEKMICKDNLTS